MSLIIQPRYIALDTSQLGTIARDMFAIEEASRQRAESFRSTLEKSDSVLLLSWHHFQELFSHQDPSTLAQRVAFLRSLPVVATPKSIEDTGLPGSIIDLQVQEVRIAFEQPEASASFIRNRVARGFIKVMAGHDAVSPFIEDWPRVRREFARQQERQRKVVGISRSGFADMSKTKIVDLMRGRLRERPDAAEQLRKLHDRLTNDLRQHGDKRLRDPEDSSGQFMDEIWGRSASAGNPHEFVLAILAESGITPAEIGPETTVGDVGRLAIFRRKLELLNRHLHLPWPELKARVTADRLPCVIVQDAITRYRPRTREWKGSDLSDGYLACLSLYADVTYVDKRTREAFRVAGQKLPQFRALVRPTEKARGYEHIAQAR